MARLIGRIKHFCSNQDLNLETFILHRKFQIMNITFLCKMILTQMAIHNGFFSKWKILERIQLSNSILWTLLNQIPYSISEWKWAYTLKKSLINNNRKMLKNKGGIKEVSTFHTIWTELEKTTITWAKVFILFHSVINFNMMMIQFISHIATLIHTVIWSMIYLRLRMIFKKDQFVLENFYARPLLEMIVMWSQ